MKRITLLALVIALFYVPIANAQARVQGVVVNEEDKPVAGATVILINMEAGEGAVAPIKTNKAGKWAALLPMGGNWNIDIEAEGYVTSKGSMQISELGRAPAMKITLQRIPEPQVVEETVASTVPEEAVAAVEAGEAYMAEKKWAEAAAEFEKAHELLPEHVQIKQVLAQAYYQVGRKDEAITMLKEVHEAEPENIGVLMLLTNVLLEQGRLEEGKVMLEKVPQEMMSDPIALVNVAILLLNKGDQMGAMDYLDRAISVAPDRSEPYYYKGLICVQKGNEKIGSKEVKGARTDFEDAIVNFEKVVELAPDTPEAAESKEIIEQVQAQMKNM